MSNDWQKIKKFTPIINTPVIIKTNWRRYLARLQVSSFGGVEFNVFDKKHVVQLTTVIAWRLS